MSMAELSVLGIRSLIDSLDEVPEEMLLSLEADSRAQVRELAARLRRRAEAERERQAVQQRMLALEHKYHGKGLRLVAGVDEAGRGPLAGPVVAAAVVFEPGGELPHARDSKSIPEQRREELFKQIHDCAIAVGVGVVDHHQIDRINIHNASILAMYRAVEQLCVQPEAVLVDGKMVLKMDVPQEAVVGGDRKCLSIAAASIVAKVTRDRMMAEFDRGYPGYGFARHKGYPTADHVRALQEFGPCPIHRRTFGPVAGCGSFGKGLWTEFYHGLVAAAGADELEAIAASIRPRRGELNSGELASLRGLYKRKRELFETDRDQGEVK